MMSNLLNQDKRIILKSTDSSNNFAVNLFKEGSCEEGTVIWAIEQKKGKGQRGNVWDSEKDKNLTFSIVLHPHFIEIENQFNISKTISLAIVDFLSRYSKHVSIKWPNDIYVNDKKIAGILIENMIQGNKIACSVIGIGLNINQEIFSKNIPNPTSLKILTTKDYDLEDCLNQLSTDIEGRYNLLKNSDLEEIHKDYLSILYRCDEFHLFKKDNQTFSGKIINVSEIGQLIIELEDKSRQVFNFNEISFI